MHVKTDGDEVVIGRCREANLSFPEDMGKDVRRPLFQCEITSNDVQWRAVWEDVILYVDPRESPIYKSPLLSIRRERSLLCLPRGSFVQFADIDNSESQWRTIDEWRRELGTRHDKMLSDLRKAQPAETLEEFDKQFPESNELPGRRFQLSVLERLDRQAGCPPGKDFNHLGLVIPTDVKWGPDGPDELRVFVGNADHPRRMPDYSVRYLKPKPDAEWKVEYRQVKNEEDKSESPWLPLPELPAPKPPVPEPPPPPQ